MKIHGMMLIKNEGDFLERSLRYNLSLFDHIYIYDNGSKDNTWEVAQAMAMEFPHQVVAWKKEDKDFRDELRGEIYNAFKDQAKKGDWWCRLDADEIYVDKPHDFLSKVPSCHHVVWSTHLQYYFSEKDAIKWENNADEAAKALPNFADLPRSYQSNAGEPRFFRHRDSLVWEGAWPRHMGVVHTDRIRLKHYQYRSPKQIQRRLDTRREAAKRGYRTFLHSLETDWKQKIVNSADFHQDDLSGNYQIDEHLLPRHLENTSRRLMKYILHQLKIWN